MNFWANKQTFTCASIFIRTSSKKEKHPLVKEVNQILKELEVKNMDKPDSQLELTITELVEKFGQNDLTIETIRNALGLDTLG